MKYESSNTAVATINSTNGRLTIVGSGEAIISVKVNGSRTDSYNLIVNKRVVNVVWSSITTFTYNGTAHCPTAMANSGVSGEEIVLAISGGETNAGSYTASASIQSVNGGSIDNYDLANNTQNFEIEKATNTFAISTEVTKYVQESLDLTSLITNAGQGEVGYHIASNGTITGSSINEGNLTIGTLPANNDNNGVLAIVAQASGNSNYNPSAEFTIQVTVQKYNAMLNWASTTPSSLIITTTSSFATAEITCDNGTAGNVVYSSSNTSVISVDATTGALTPVNFGEATITATMASSSTVKGLIITQNISVVLGKLSTVTNVQWSSTNKGEATWTAVDAVAGITTTYSVQLYKGGVESGLIENIEGTTYNFASTIQSIGGGEYTFKVCAKSSNPTYCGNGEQSVESNVLYAVNVIVEKGTGVETATIDKNVLFAGKTATLTLQAKTGYILGECTSSDSTRLSISGTTATLSETNANAQSITITATATPISYTIVYNGNGETAGTMGSSEHTYDVDKNLTTSVFTRTGFTFAGWNTKANGSGTAYVNGATVKNLTSENGATVTLYAVWELVQYAIGYTLNNGTLATPNPSYYTIEDNTFSLNNPTRIGYTFAGWTGSNGATPQINVQIEQGSTGEKSFTANWTPITYTIVYNGNENTSGTMANSEHTYDVDQNLTTNGFTKTGYTFAGWNTKANGSGTAYENEATVKNLTSENGATVTLYAIWSTGSYTVSLNVQGGKGGTSSVTATYGSAMPSATAPTKEGYTFAGYYDATSGGTQYYTSGMTSAKNWDKASNTTLYAHWTANTYTITFDNQGVTGGTSSVTATYGSAMPSATAPTKEGYTFAGYYDATSGGTQYYTSGMTSAKNWDKASNTTLYAYWTATTYTITYNLNDGSASNPTSYTIETPTFTLNNPTRTGFAFTGWSGTGLTGSTNTSVTISQGSTGNKTYTANWTAKTYTITFDKQSGTSGTSSVTATYGSAMPSATAPTRTGYTFGGYYTSTNGGGTQYYNASMVSVRNWDKTSATTLYAKWTINQYTATFDGNGGSSGGTITKDYNTALGTLPTSSRAGSAFNGWWTSTSGGTQITSSTLLTQNVIYYAHWTPAVAQIGTAYYATLGIAIDAVPNNGTATIEIIGDTSESGLIIGDKKKITLVANGANRTITRNANSVLFTIRSGATLTLGLSATDANVINIIGSNQANSVIVNHGTLNLNSANIYGGVNASTPASTGPNTGGGVYVSGSSAQFTMSGGTIQHCKATSAGGGVYVSDGTFTMSGGTIANNTAKYGGGVSVSGSSAQFTMSGGEISGNTAGSGGGVGAWDGTFTMDGGTISGNTATSYGGGVYMYGESVEFTMNDGTISDNTAGSGGGVYMHGKSVTTGGVITYNRGTFNMNGGIISGNTTTGDGGGVEVIIVDFTMDGGTISGNELTGSNGYGGGVYVYLGTFTMSDGEISDNTAGDGGGVYVAGSIFTMDGGEISDNTAGDGGGVSANSAQGVDGVSYSRISEFNMTGGTISGNTATSYGGGGVEVGNGTFTMSGGTISGNTATSDGGGVFVFYSATFNMTGGTISNNTAESGGGVYVSNGGTFEMYNGTISGNSTTSTGGGVYVFNSGTFTMSGGTIYGSTAGANANTATIGASLYKSGSGGIAQYGNYATITTPNNDTIIGHA